jgi:hypothetical protein
VARLRNWLPATRTDLRILWDYVLGQTHHHTKLAERVARLEADLGVRPDAPQRPDADPDRGGPNGRLAP